MSSEKKAFKVVYGLIKENLLAEKDAYSLIDGIFQKEYYPVAVPNPIDVTSQENQQEQVKQIEVAGFRLPE